MSEHKVLVTKIDEVFPHPNADRLELVRVGGWICVTGKGNFTAGDTCVYIPIDSVLPYDIEILLFPIDSKIKLNKSRIRTIKIRGCVSQGMCVKFADIGLTDKYKVGQDLAGILKITKYEPPQKISTRSNCNPVKKLKNNPHFRKYTDLENIKNYHGVFKDGEPVVITEKIHGTNFRCGWVPFVARTWWQKIVKFFGRAPEYEFVYGSRNLQLQDKINPKTYYDKNVYAECVQKYGLKDAIPKGHVIYGEIYGPDIQKGYHYGCVAGERDLAIFDVFRTEDEKFLPHDAAIACLVGMDLEAHAVPVLYTGPFDQAIVAKLTVGDSVLNHTQKIREGVVIRPIAEDMSTCGRKILKSISPDYLLSKAADEEVAHDQVG